MESKRYIRDTAQIGGLSIVAMGAFAGLAEAAWTWAAASLELTDFRMESLAASLVGFNPGSLPFALALIIHLAFSAMIAFAYASILKSAHRSGFGVGLNLSLYHWTIGGIGIGIAGLLYGTPWSPGFFAFGGGFSSALVYFTAHLVYGGLFGTLFDRASIRREFRRSLTASA